MAVEFCFFLPVHYLWNFSSLVRGGHVTLDMSERLWELEGISAKVSSSLVAGVRVPKVLCRRVTLPRGPLQLARPGLCLGVWLRCFGGWLPSNLRWFMSESWISILVVWFRCLF